MSVPPRRLPAGLSRLGLPAWTEILWLAIGLVLVLRYAWILDDAFVYYRYLDNLLFLELGLVYNQGEYVEGYSSPLWMLLLIPLRATGLDYWTLTKVLAVVGFTGFWALLVRVNRELSPPGVVTNVPLAFLSVSYGTLCYFTSGVETPLVQITAVLYAWLILRPGSVPLQFLVGWTPLIRYELALPLLIVAAWSWHRTRRFPVALAATAAATMGAWLLFKIRYYAELLPSTFYLKNDTNVAQGLLYVWQTVGTYQLLPLLLVFAVVAWHLGRRGGDRLAIAPRIVMVLVALAVTLYVVKIGGDPRHHRYLAFPFVLLVCSVGGLAERLIATAPARVRRGVAAAVALGVGGISFSLYPPQLDRHPVTGTEEHQRVDSIHDASWHRHLPSLEFHEGRAEQDRQRREAYRAATAYGFRYRGAMTGSMCVDIYDRFAFRVVHDLGLTDAFLARTDAEPDLPAHKYSLRPRARDLARIYREHRDPDAALFRELVESGDAPPWIEENLASIEVIARKVYNRHEWGENLGLALSFPERIRIPDWREDPTFDLERN